MQATRTRSLRALACALVLLSGWGGGPCAEETSLELPRKVWSALESAAKALAGAARGDDLEELLDVLRGFGREAEDVADLRKGCQKALARGKRKPRNDAKAGKALAQAVARLRPRVLEAEEPLRRRLALLLLRLDDRLDDVQEAAGHVRSEGTWTPPWMAPLLARRREVADALRTARRLEIPIRTGPSAHPLLKTIHGRAGHQASWRNVTIHSVTFGPDRLQRILRQTLRALALSHWLRGGPLEVPAPPAAFVGVKLPRVVDYQRAVDHAVTTGGLPAAEAAEYRDLRWFRHARAGYVVVGYRTEATVEASMLDDLLSATSFGRAQPCLYVGHICWLCQAILGTWPPGWLYEEDEAKRADAGTSRSPADVEERRQAQLVARAGLAGTRTYMRYLVRRREDPPWTKAMQDRNGKIQGDALLKTTMVTEFLQEHGSIQPLVQVQGSGVAQLVPAFENALKLPMAEFERRWRAWMVPARASIARRLEASQEGAGGLDAPTRALLEHLHRVRVAALETPQPDILPPLITDPELSAGCEAHARYLHAHPAQKETWPEAHEEFPDQAGFSTEGSLAGLNSVIAFGAKPPVGIVDEWLGTFYHRLPLLHPGLRRIGWGFAQKVAVLDCASMVTDSTHQVQARWPHPGQTDVPRSFQPELPNPVPGADQSAWGYPVTLQNHATTWDTEALRMRLYRGSAKPTHEVECHVSSPDRPTNPELAPAQTWCLIPKQKLAAKQRYVVVVTGVPQQPDWRWTFTTGAR